MKTTSYKIESVATLRNIGGALFFLVLAGLAAWKWEACGRIFHVLLAFRFLLLAYFTVGRLPAMKTGTAWQSALAFAASFLPFAYGAYGSVPSGLAVLVSNLLFIAGYSLAAVAAIELGSRFGVSPAVRGEVCRTGVYRFLRHPMYAGYAIAEFGWVLLNPWNISIFIVSMGLQVARAKMESRLLS